MDVFPPESKSRIRPSIPEGGTFVSAFAAVSRRRRRDTASTYGATASLGANAHAARYASRHTLSSRSAFGWSRSVSGLAIPSTRIAAPKRRRARTLQRLRKARVFRAGRGRRASWDLSASSPPFGRGLFLYARGFGRRPRGPAARGTAPRRRSTRPAPAAAVSAPIGDDACDAAAGRPREDDGAPRRTTKPNTRGRRAFPAGSET